MAGMPNKAAVGSRKQDWLRQVNVRRLKAFLIGVTCILVVASALTSYFITQRQDALQRLSRYNMTWLASVAPVEVMRLEAAIAESEVVGSGVDQEQVQLRLDIVRNRITLLDSGETRDFIIGRPDLEATVRQLRSMADEAQPLVDNLGQGDTVSRLLKLVSPLSPLLLQLAAAANIHGGDLVARDQQEFSRLHTIFSGIIMGLIICGFVLIGVMMWHNKLLQRAHTKVKLLVQSLQAAGAELANANVRVQETMEEVQLQNRILQEHDRTLNTQNARFDAALNNMSQALCMVDQQQKVIVCNVRFLELFGLTAGMVQPGAMIRDVFRNAVAVGRYEPETIEAIFGEQRELVATGRTGSFFQEDSIGRAVAVSHQPMSGSGWVATYEDISERRRAEARIHFMAHHDALTCLPNRLFFKDRLERVLKGVRCGDGEAAVLCLDLDNFKDVNDTLGHSAGDRLLEKVAQRLHGCIRDGDVVARLGGDEFVILQMSGSQPEQAEALARRIVEAIRVPYDIDGARVVVGTSIGIAIAPGDGIDVNHLLKNADMALYRAKTDGRETYRFFEADMDVQVQARRETELSLREAIARRELVVYYQPLFDLAANKITGFEALLRWCHPVHGMVSPAQFIPIAERVGLIAEIGEWVLGQACHDAATWPEDITVAVNLSPLQFRNSNLVQAVRSTLDASGLLPRRLELEITESALLKDSDSVLAMLQEIRSLGVGIALDDFGTGYASLSYLRNFPFNKIKIDRSFVGEMGRPDCLAIVHSIAQLASKLGMATTAEGVETLEQLGQVREAGCTQAQGYYFDRPRPSSEIVRWFVHAAREMETTA